MTRQAINPPQLFNSLQYGFSQITIATGSRIISVSGQVAWDEHEQIAAADFRSQTMKAFHNLEVALLAAGASLDEVVSLRLYIVADHMDDSAPIRDALEALFPADPPTATWIGVPRLANPAFLIEVEALAVLP
jgi:enamine deaminase RidA (YjgF/YER057c/UK114 family)